MGDLQINEQILEGIRENSEGDKVLENFLIELIYEEAKHPGQWHWREEYRKRIDKHLADWGEGDEN